jgi:hypothetical protein
MKQIKFGKKYEKTINDIDTKFTFTLPCGTLWQDLYSGKVYISSSSSERIYLESDGRKLYIKDYSDLYDVIKRLYTDDIITPIDMFQLPNFSAKVNKM